MIVAFYALTDEDLLLNRLPIARPLRDAGYRVVVLGPGTGHVEQIQAGGFEYHRVASRGATLLADVTSTIALIRTLKQIRPDILHTFGLYAALRGGLAARFAHMSWVVHSVTAPRRDVAKRPSPILRAALRDSEVAFLLKEDRDAFIARRFVRPEQTHVLRNTGVDLRDIPVREAPDRTPAVAALVLPQSQEDLRRFVDAARLVRGAGVAGRFAVIGPAPSPDVLPMLHGWQEEGILEWWGDRDDLVAALGSVHVICLPAGTDEHTMILASAVGRPLIVTGDAVDGHIVQPGQSGLQVPEDDVRALGDALRELLSDADRRARMGRKARAIVESDYSADRVAREIMIVYERLFEKGRSV